MIVAVVPAFAHPTRLRIFSRMTTAPSFRKESALVRIGGYLSIAACIIGMAIFVGACFGFSAAFGLSFIPLAMASVGLILSIVGGTNHFVAETEGTQVLAAIFVSVFGILGALILMAAWLNWTVFPGMGLKTGP